MKTLKVTNFALQGYRSFVKGNFNLSSKEVEKKLTRNVILGKKIGEIEGQSWYAYGQLRILVKNNNTVACVMNHNSVLEDWELDLEKKALLDEILEIAQ